MVGQDWQQMPGLRDKTNLIAWDVIEMSSNDQEVSKHWTGIQSNAVGLYVSTIPETYRYQLNVYLDLCSERPQPRYIGNRIDTDEVTRVCK